MDDTYDNIISIFRKLFEKKIEVIWFSWLEWVTIGAAIYAIGKSAQSLLLMIVGILSGIMLFFRALIGIEDLFITNAPIISERIGKIWTIIISMAVAIFPILLMIFISNVFGNILK